MSAAETRSILEAAMAAHRRGDIAAASTGYQEVLRRDPRNSDALNLQGAILGKTDPAAGAALITQSLAVRPDSKEAHINLASIEARRWRMEEAEHHFRRAFELDPTDATIFAGLGGTLLHLGRYEEAEKHLRSALERRPSDSVTVVNLGILMDARGRFDEAMKYYDLALELRPDNTEPHMHKGFALLARGRFAEGWREHAWRVNNISTFFGRFSYPYWAGEPLEGRKILVWTEQGLGDEILTATMIPDLIQRGARVVLLCALRLVALFRRTFPTAIVIPMGERPQDPSIMKDIDFQASMSDLGLQLRRDFESFDRSGPLLKHDDNLTQRLRKKYRTAADSKLLVGVSWRSKNKANATIKSIPLQAWEPILRVPGVEFVSLQYGPVDADLASVQNEFGVTIRRDNDIDPLGDMDAFAAQVAAMDLVISVSNTTVHVAGALNRPTWVLVPGERGRMWYWLLERSDSPWYPSARLFRYDPIAHWDRAIGQIAAELKLLVKTTARDAEAGIPAS